jgi:error-prone DNA polymerase
MYAELQSVSNFSFLRGASHPQELMWRAAELGYKAVALTDYNTLSGVVRAHAAARDAGIQYIVGCRLEVDFQGEIRHPFTNRSSQYKQTSLLVYPTTRKGYGALCRLLTHGKRDVSKNDFFLTLADFLPLQNEFVTVAVPPFFQTPLQSVGGFRRDECSINERHAVFYEICKVLKENCIDPRLLSISLTYNYGPQNKRLIDLSVQVARALSLSVVATNDVHYHVPERKPLQDLVTCIREHCTVQQAGFRLFQNSERFLKPVHEMQRLFRDIPQAIYRTGEIAELTSNFSLSDLTYTYPAEICPENKRPEDYLREAVYAGARERYPSGIPEHVSKNIEDELALIRELEYEKYFLTCYDIVQFARSREILCQGRGAAANSTVCFCLGITSVDPQKIDLLFARFISKERQEPPDIDIDFEHERREEVIQYIYKKFGRDRAAIAAAITTYRPRSAVRDVGKALGLSGEIIAKLAKSVHHWTGYAVTSENIRELGLDPFDTTVQNTIALSAQLVGFPRHLTQHVGGFIISHDPLCEIVPIINAGMESRTIIEWDKNDIEELGMLKIDVLALGMLTCIRKALALINTLHGKEYSLHSLPQDDPAVYDMLCASDSVGVFQVESRAQMSMLPRLKPRCFYDLVIEVAIVRPGPIQGNMVHPFLRRRAGLEKPYFPDERVKRILGKTLGVPIFQEQAMRLAITLANFSPGEAEKLRRAMAAWKTQKGVIEAFKEKIFRGMKENGYSEEFADTCLNQIKGFSEYGFPESHAASFALLVYASAWIKRHYPAEFAASLINSQPMGFYAPAQLIRDAQAHGVTVEPIDANKSTWDCSVYYATDKVPHIRLGLRLIAGLRHDHAQALRDSVETTGEFSSISELWGRGTGVTKVALRTLAHADSFSSLELSRRPAQWSIQELAPKAAPLDALFTPRAHSDATLPATTTRQEMLNDYATTGLSLRAHPIQFLRTQLSDQGAKSTRELLSKHGIPVGTNVSTAGLVITRQRPGTAKGVVFITLEDEFGSLNLIIRPALFEQHSTTVLSAAILYVTGRLQRVGEVIYVEVNELRRL